MSELTNYINNVYNTILQRDVDNQGLSHYTRMIKLNRIKKENLANYLMRSKEYKQNIELLHNVQSFKYIDFSSSIFCC